MKMKPGLLASMMLVAVASAQAQAEGKFAVLYPAKAPADMAYVRMVNPGSETLDVQVAKGPKQSIGPKQIASSYALLKGSTAFVITVAGKRVGEWTVTPGSFNTVVPQAGGYAVIEDETGSENALKAELRFYNLAGECPKGRLTTADGKTMLFPDVPAGGTTARAINPVNVALSAGCGEVQADQWPLSGLKAGIIMPCS
ncbi:alginate O-acetyltransferase AlgF [Pseudomonas sp. NY15354]|uniref:alginate O-acetyltransferase AlgF n=1 Tax=Pseudomonas sp. NY15354 TaxID=3400351 RepID=UPI003A84BCD4